MTDPEKTVQPVHLRGDRRARSAYSAAVRAGDFLFLSGIGPLDADARVLGNDIVRQTEITMENVVDVLKAGDSSIRALVSVRVYLKDLQDYDSFNRVYETFVKEEPYPARCCLQAGALWEGVLVEIEAVALAGS